MGIHGLVRVGVDMRPIGLLLAGVVTVMALIAFGAPSKASAGTWCSDDPTPPCVSGAWRNAVPVTSSDANWDVSVTPYSSGGSHSFLWNLETKVGADPYELPLSELGAIWSIAFNTGSLVPRVSFTRGWNVSVYREGAPGMIDVSGLPVGYTEGCDVSAWPWVCSAIPASGRQAIFGGEVTDYGSWENVSERNAMHGMDISTNIEAVSVPPEIQHVGSSNVPQILLRLGNSHFELDGTTVFNGFVRMLVPAAFLKQAYGLDDIKRLVSSGIQVSLEGATAGEAETLVVERHGNRLLISAQDVNFSTRQLRFRIGSIKPGKPGKVKTKRINAAKAKVSYKKSKSRGSKVRKYEARCMGKGFKQTRKGKSTKASVTVKKLTAGKAYACQVRAISKAGPSPWSKKTTLKR